MLTSYQKDTHRGSSSLLDLFMLKCSSSVNDSLSDNSVGRSKFLSAVFLYKAASIISEAAAQSIVMSPVRESYFSVLLTQSAAAISAAPE